MPNQTPDAQQQQQQQQQPGQQAKPASKPVDKDAISEFSKRFLGGEPDDLKPKEPKDKPPKEQSDDQAPPADQDPQPQDKPKPQAAPKPKRTAPRAQAPSVEKIAEAVSEGVARAIGKQQQQAQQPPEKPEEPELPPDEKRKLQVFEQMERQFPDQYKGLPKKYKDSLKKALEYAAQWEKENPGQEFNEEDPEHAEFFETNAVEYEDDHFVDALTEVKINQRMPKVQEIEKKVGEIDRQEQIRQKMPIIDRHQALAARSFFSQMGDEYAGIVKEDGSVDQEVLAKLRETKPVEAQMILMHASKRVEPIAGEIFKLYDGLSSLDLKNNPVHRWINDFALDAERQLLSRPENERLNEAGLPFVTAEQYGRLTPQQRRQCWTFGAEDLSALAAHQMASELSEEIEAENKKYEAWAKARGLMPKDEQGTPPQEDGDEPPVNERGKPISPEAGAEPRMARGATSGRLEGDSPKKAFFGKFLG